MLNLNFRFLNSIVYKNNIFNNWINNIGVVKWGGGVKPPYGHFTNIIYLLIYNNNNLLGTNLA